MINILILDDNPNKIHELKQVLIHKLGIPIENIEVKTDLYTGKIELLNKQYDLLILDLVLPERFGDFPDKNAGFFFLKELNFDDQYKLPKYTLGFTAYPDINELLSKDFHTYLSLIITYNQGFINWEEDIILQIKSIIRKSESERTQVVNTAYNYDLAIVTALAKPELEHILRLFDSYQEEKISNDSTIYYVGEFRSQSKIIKVVAASADQMGLTAAATLSSKLIQHFRPKYLTMTGIAAGIKGKTNFGDIIIADIVWDYGNGKITTLPDGTMGFNQDPRQEQLEPYLKALFQKEDLKGEIVEKIKQDWLNLQAKNKPNKLVARISPMASGAAVIENIKMMNSVIDKQRKVLAVDMEAYAIFYAANHSTDPKPKPIAIKSICDFGDSKKNDKMQTYAAFTSAKYLYYFSLSYL